MRVQHSSNGGQPSGEELGIGGGADGSRASLAVVGLWLEIYVPTGRIRGQRGVKKDLRALRRVLPQLAVGGDGAVAGARGQFRPDPELRQLRDECLAGSAGLANNKACIGNVPSAVDLN